MSAVDWKQLRHGDADVARHHGRASSSLVMRAKKQPRYGCGFRLAGGMIPFIRRYSTICP